MSKGTRFALALILLWASMVCFYVAFHPGGVQVPGPDPDSKKGTSHTARNPADVLKFMFGLFAQPTSVDSGGNSVQGA